MKAPQVDAAAVLEGPSTTTYVLTGVAYAFAAIASAVAVLALAWQLGAFNSVEASAGPPGDEWMSNVANECLGRQPAPSLFARCLREGVNAEHAHGQGPFVANAIACRRSPQGRKYVCDTDGTVRGYRVCVRQFYVWRRAKSYDKALVYLDGGLIPCAAVKWAAR